MKCYVILAKNAQKKLYANTSHGQDVLKDIKQCPNCQRSKKQKKNRDTYHQNWPNPNLGNIDVLI
jgi:hypothetical protein